MESEKRAQILTVAKKRFERFGFNKTTVDEIAKDASIRSEPCMRNLRIRERFLKNLSCLKSYPLEKPS